MYVCMYIYIYVYVCMSHWTPHTAATGVRLTTRPSPLPPPLSAHFLAFRDPLIMIETWLRLHQKWNMHKRGPEVSPLGICYLWATDWPLVLCPSSWHLTCWWTSPALWSSPSTGCLSYRGQKRVQRSADPPCGSPTGIWKAAEPDENRPVTNL